MRKPYYIAILFVAVIELQLPSAAQTGSKIEGHWIVEPPEGFISPPLKDVLHRSDSLSLEKLPIGKRVVGMGRLLLDRPYLEKTLEKGDDHTVECNLDGFDCVTFFENAWALARLCRQTARTKDFFATQLAASRYRDGQLSGFQSRLHYTTDYFFNDAERGLLKEMTRSVGKEYAILETKPINFMTTHPNLYKQLKDDPAMVAKMDSIEKMVAARGGFYYIKKENVAKVESGIQDGDLIGVTTSIPGIDCSHTGIAVREKDGRIHFMNASSVFHKVIISKEPLADYLANNSKQTGIIIYRPQEVQ